MMSNIRADVGGLDPMQLARQAATEAEAETMISLLEPQYYAMDTCLIELVKQVIGPRGPRPDPQLPTHPISSAPTPQISNCTS